MNKAEQKLLAEYLKDLYDVFVRDISRFVIADDFNPTATIRLPALLEEIIKVKKLIIKK